MGDVLILVLKKIYLCHVVTLVMDLAPAHQACWWQVFTKRIILDFSIKSETLLRVLVLTIPISGLLSLYQTY